MPELTPEELAAQAAAAEKAAQEAAAAEEEAKKAAEAAKKKEDDLSKLTPEEMRALIEKERSERQAANREAQALRKKANDLEAAEKKRAESEMTDLEKANARVKELEETSKKAALEAQDTRIMLAAARLGFQDPRDAVALINRADLAEDEKNLDTLLKAVLKEKAYLAKTDSGLPGRKPGANPGGSAEELSDEEKRKKATGMFPTLKRLVGRQ